MRPVRVERHHVDHVELAAPLSEIELEHEGHGGLVAARRADRPGEARRRTRVREAPAEERAHGLAADHVRSVRSADRVLDGDRVGEDAADDAVHVVLGDEREVAPHRRGHLLGGGHGPGQTTPAGLRARGARHAVPLRGGVIGARACAEHPQLRRRPAGTRDAAAGAGRSVDDPVGCNRRTADSERAQRQGRGQGRPGHGCGAGTGEQTARILVDEGARVVVATSSTSPAPRWRRDLGDAALFLHVDVASEESWAEAVSRAVDHFGALDGLVNNAGLFHMEALEDTALPDYERLVRVNQIGPFLGMRSVVPAMKERGGAIVNVSSFDGLSAKNGLVAYAATKWALRGMTRVAALELGKYGIRVNAVCPEAGGPEMRAPYVPDGIDPAQTLAFTHRLLSYQQARDPIDLVRDIARMVVFLLSDDALSCTGADYPVDAAGPRAST